MGSFLKNRAKALKQLLSDERYSAYDKEIDTLCEGHELIDACHWEQVVAESEETFIAVLQFAEPDGEIQTKVYEFHKPETLKGYLDGIFTASDSDRVINELKSLNFAPYLVVYVGSDRVQNGKEFMLAVRN